MVPAAPQPNWSWLNSPFFTQHLPTKAEELARDRPGLRRCGTLRQAIDTACGALYEYLPLETSTFCSFDVAAELLMEPARATVVAEQICRVPDANRPPRKRVDLIVYKPNGDVIRFHPGRQAAGGMQPHLMPLNTLCFHKDEAAQYGVGWALHHHPPALVEHELRALAAPVSVPGRPLATRADMDQLCQYDVKSINWRQVRDLLQRLPDHDHTVDWSDGAEFPWWVWMANTGVLRDIVNEGVLAVELEVHHGEASVLVHSVGGGL